MKTSINLVSKKRTPSSFHRRFFIAGLALFSIAFLISAGLISYRLILAGQLSVLKEEETRLTSIVNSNPEKKVKYLAVRERLSEIQKVISNRKNINNKVISVSDTLPSNVDISVIHGEEKEVTIEVAAADLSSLNDLIEERVAQYAQESNRTVRRVEMNSFKLDPTSNRYNVSFTVEFQ